MSQPQAPPDAKLIMGFLFRDFALQRSVLGELCAQFGPMDCLTEPHPFTYTAYYEREMGEGIFRQTASFLELVRPERLPEIKLTTNAIEARFAEGSQRRVNIDPGLLSEERLILATGKNFTHRVYLREGIYADLTLIYTQGAYQTLPWTYPDHRDPRVRHLLAVLRQKLIFQRTGRLPRKGLPLPGGPPCSAA